MESKRCGKKRSSTDEAMMDLMMLRVRPTIEFKRTLVKFFSATTTVNPLETKKFSSQNVFEGHDSLKEMHPCRMGIITNYLVDKIQNNESNVSELLKGKSVLDVGSGGGLLTNSLLSLGARHTHHQRNQRETDRHRYHDGSRRHRYQFVLH